MTDDITLGRAPGQPRPPLDTTGARPPRGGTQGDPARRVPLSAVPAVARAVKVRRLHRLDETPALPTPLPGDLSAPGPPATGLQRLAQRLPWSSQWLALRRLLVR